MPPRMTGTAREIADALSPPAWLVAVSIVCFVIGGIVVWAVSPRIVANASIAEVSVNKDGFSISLRGGGNVDVKEVLDSLSLMPDEWARVKTFMATEHGLHSLEGMDFVYTMDTMLVDRKPGESDAVRTRRLRASMREHRMMGIKELRRRSDELDVPFQDFGSTIEVGMPHETARPARFTVSVQVGSPMAHKVVEVGSPHSSRSLRLLAVPRIAAEAENVDAHIRESQADYLGLDFVERRELVSVQALSSEGGYVEAVGAGGEVERIGVEEWRARQANLP